MRRSFGTIFFFFLAIHDHYAQSPFFQSYSLLKRNETVQVNVVFQDKSGFIWYGTNKGLFRFDGINQLRYTHSDSLPDNHVTAIAQDSSGRIWAGHRNGNLSFLDKGLVHKFVPEGSSSNEISDILFDREGNLWFSTLNDGLYYYTNERLFRVDEEEGLPDLFVYDLAEDPIGNIWAGTDGGVGICTLKDGKVTIKVLNYRQGLPDNIVKKLIIGKNNTVWMGTEDAGVVAYNSFSGKSTPLIKEGWKFGALTDFLIQGNQVWIASQQTGLIVYDINTGRHKIYNNSNTKAGIDLTSINTVLTDEERNIWIGSKSGVTRTLGNHVEYIDAFDPYKDTNVSALTVDSKNNLWYATGDGLFRRNVGESGVVQVERPLSNTAFQKNTIISLYTDSTGYIWAGLYGEGVLRIDPSSGKIRNLSKELRNGNILNITGRGNVVWLATLEGATRITISGNDLELKNYTHKEGLISDYIYQVFIDSRKRAWFATDGRGVGMLDESGFHHFEKGLNTKVVYGFAEDKNHVIWANVQEEGLYKFDGKAFHILRSESPLRDKNISCLTSDVFGNLITIHDLGIDVYDVTANKMRYLGDEFGIGNKKPNLNALAKDKEGRVYVGTDHGIIDYADQSKDLLTLPKPVIAGLRVSGKPIDLTDPLRFSYDQNNVVIQYLGFWYQNPSNLNYQYKLENYDKDWIKTRDRSTTYSSLPPGDYTFQLQTSDSEDFRNVPASSFKFTIHPPFWRTTWFYLLTAVVLVLSGSAYIQYRERKLLDDKRMLEIKVRERTMEIQQQAEEIQAQNEEIQSQAEEIQGINDNLEELVRARTAELEKKNKAAEESAFIIAHELRAPVASVLGLINLISKIPLNKDGKAIVAHMEESAEKLNTVVRNITKAIERGDR